MALRSLKAHKIKKAMALRDKTGTKKQKRQKLQNRLQENRWQENTHIS